MDTLFYVNVLIKWSNDNQGIVSVIIFVLTIVYGWLSGTFAALRQKPRFRFRLIEGPTFACTFGIGAEHNGYDVHRTGIALYMHISNVGSSASDLEAIHIGYKWAVKPFSVLWWKYAARWFWLTEQAIAISDFQVSIGENKKFYPFLTQRSVVSGTSAETYLEVGQSTRGVVYFEQNDSFGACFPRAYRNRIRVKIKIIDSFGVAHVKKFYIPRVSLEEAWRFNPSFGLTYTTIREGERPFDLPTDQHGNLIPNIHSKA